MIGLKVYFMETYAEFFNVSYSVIFLCDAITYNVSNLMHLTDLGNFLIMIRT